MMEHSIRTFFGNSTETYGGTYWRLLPHDTIKANDTSPIIWASISTVLFWALKEKNYGGGFRSPITNLLMTLAGFAFVDDMDLLQTQHHHTDTLDEIVDGLQGSLDMLQGTLNTSGGALDCDDRNRIYWYGIDYEWNTNGRWKYCAFDIILKLMMYDDSGGRKEVPHCHTDEAH